jgi:hypothetical protein
METGDVHCFIILSFDAVLSLLYQMRPPFMALLTAGKKSNKIMYVPNVHTKIEASYTGQYLKKMLETKRQP